MKRMFIAFISILLILLLCACESIDSGLQSSTSEHTHQIAAKEQTVSEPISGYCGNTITTIYFDENNSYEFWGGESVTMTDILVNLDSEDDGIVTVSCAGGVDFIAKLPIETKTLNGELVKVTLSGFSAKAF